VKQEKSHSQRAQRQSQSSAAREPQSISLSERLALSPREFAAAVGRSPTFAYRAIYRGWIKPISDGVRMMIPHTEVQRFLGRAAEYNPRKQMTTTETKGGNQ
jgi:hypothetical protein